MKKVLLITYYWPPSGGPGVQRVLKLAKYLPQTGWQPIILTVKDGDYPALDPELERDVPEDCKVYKTPAWEPYELYRKFTGKKSNETLPTFILNPPKNEGIKDKIAKWIRVNLFIPDARIGWFPRAIKTGGRIIKNESIDLIFSTSPPPTAHLIAKYLAWKHKLKWIADFRDPWTEAFWLNELQKDGFAKNANLFLEKSVLTSADMVTTVTDGIVELLSAKVLNHYVVLHNGFEKINRKKFPSEKFIILFFGHLNKYQNKEGLFKAISTLPQELQRDIEVIFIGKIFEDFQKTCEKYPHLNISIRDYMPYLTMMKFAQNASILYRPLTDTTYIKGVVGAKTYDYLSLRKPILALGPKGCFLETLLQSTASGQLFDENAISEIAGFIRSYFEIWQKQRYILLDDNEALNPFKTSHNINLLSQLFHKVLTTNR